jgi:hypothetical protein
MMSSWDLAYLDRTLRFGQLGVELPDGAIKNGVGILLRTAFMHLSAKPEPAQEDVRSASAGRWKK